MVNKIFLKWAFRPIALKCEHSPESSEVLFKADCWALPFSFKWVGGREALRICISKKKKKKRFAFLASF